MKQDRARALERGALLLTHPEHKHTHAQRETDFFDFFSFCRKRGVAAAATMAALLPLQRRAHAPR
jgi:hypothetical protein